jgi:hypothetical protein
MKNKTTELEKLTHKLGELTKASVDVTANYSFLKRQHEELSEEAEMYKRRFQSMEVELEMTKMSSE